MQQTASRTTQFSASHLAAAVLMAFAGVTTASAATLSVGPGKTYAKPCAAIAAAKDGDVIEITGNTTYSGDVCYIMRHNLTIRGVNGRPKIDAAGKNAGGKGIWVVDGNNLTVDNVEMYGAKVPDANGAAFRLEAAGFTLRNSFLHDNQNGILANANANSDVVIENTEFGHNGAGDGQSHNLYIGHVKSLTFRYNFSHDANVGHNLKSRADTNLIAYNRFSSLNPGETGSTAAGKPSYEIDLPNAGTSYVIGNIIQQPASNSNSAMLAYGEEGAVNAGSDLYVINNTFLNDMGSGGTFMFVSGKVPTPAVAQNNIYAGVGTFSTQASTIDKTNYRSASPSFANRAAYDLHPVGSALVIDAGSDPGVSAKGVSLKAVAQYKAVAAGEARPVVGQIDIGAYESLTAPTTTTASWTACGNEGSTCAFSGTREVRFGANGVYTSKMITASTPCTTAVFGDPIRGVVKSCSYAGTTTTAAPVASTPTFTACATENGTCSFTGKREVRYGTSTIYTSKVVTGPVACTNAVFGDPARGQVKSCSYSSVTQ
ncbi:hypothetical protein ACEN9H_29785 [Massilia cellulosiltytica]|uniref:hypothetical protein n=1 Tax=Massilia cellulosiltytica TaxID=2683234 RepID=UPI0039B5EA51